MKCFKKKDILFFSSISELYGHVFKLCVARASAEALCCVEDGKQQNSRNGAFEEGTYVMSAEASSLYKLAALPLAFTLSLALPLLLLLRFPEV